MAAGLHLSIRYQYLCNDDAVKTDSGYNLQHWRHDPNPVIGQDCRWCRPSNRDHIRYQIHTSDDKNHASLHESQLPFVLAKIVRERYDQTSPEPRGRRCMWLPWLCWEQRRQNKLIGVFHNSHSTTERTFVCEWMTTTSRYALLKTVVFAKFLNKNL